MERGRPAMGDCFQTVTDELLLSVLIDYEAIQRYSRRQVYSYEEGAGFVFHDLKCFLELVLGMGKEVMKSYLYKHSGCT